MFNTKPTNGTYCPYIKKACIKDECMFWQSVPVEDMDTKMPSMKWDCVFNHIGALLWETAVWGRGGQKATEELRNVIIDQKAAHEHTLQQLQALEHEHTKMKKVIAIVGHQVKQHTAIANKGATHGTL